MNANETATVVLAERTDEHFAYLDECVRNGLISEETKSQARLAWIMIEGCGDRIPVPAAVTGPDGEMFYSWNRGPHHLELEIIPGQPAEWFYRNRETEEYAGDDWTVGEIFPKGWFHKVRLFQADANN